METLPRQEYEANTIKSRSAFELFVTSTKAQLIPKHQPGGSAEGSYDVDHELASQWSNMEHQQKKYWFAQADRKAMSSPKSSPRQKPTKRRWMSPIRLMKIPPTRTSQSLSASSAPRITTRKTPPAKIRQFLNASADSGKQLNEPSPSEQPYHSPWNTERSLFIAIHAHQALDSLELSLKLEDNVNVIDDQSLDWWYVHKIEEGKVGWVPSSCLKKVSPIPPLIDEPNLDLLSKSPTISEREISETAVKEAIASGCVCPANLTRKKAVPSSYIYPDDLRKKDGTTDGIIHPDDLDRYENRTKMTSHELTPWPESLSLKDLALDKVEFTPDTSEWECNFCIDTNYGCTDILLSTELATGVCSSCKQANQDFISDENYEPVETRPTKYMPTNKEKRIDNLYMSPRFCKYSPYGYIDINKALICEPCKASRMSIIPHRHLEFIPSGGMHCMVCTNVESNKCEGCPLQLCNACSVMVVQQHEGELDLLIYDMLLCHEHIRNDVVLLRKDGGGYYPPS